MNTDITPRANSAPVPSTRYEFKITDEHGCVLICSALPTLEEAESKGRQYVAEYQQDVPCTLTLELRRVEVLHVSSTKAPTPPTDGELNDEKLLQIAETEIAIDDIMEAHQEGYPIEVITIDLITFGRAAIAADRARRRGQEILAVRDQLFPDGCPDSVDYLSIWNELTAESVKAEAGE